MYEQEPGISWITGITWLKCLPACERDVLLAVGSPGRLDHVAYFVVWDSCLILRPSVPLPGGVIASSFACFCLLLLAWTWSFLRVCYKSDIHGYSMCVITVVNNCVINMMVAITKAKREVLIRNLFCCCC